jgi:hypothetical protein
MTLPARPRLFALWLGCAVFVVGGVFAFVVSRSDGVDHFYKRSTDSRDYRLVAASPFGTGSAFDVPGRGGAPEASYRYGRIGLPVVASVLAGGQPGGIDVTLVLVNLAAIGAIVALAAQYLGDLDRDPLLGLLVLLAPGLILLLDRVYAEPLAIAFVLAALLVDERGRRWWPVVLLASAVLVRETTALAIIPFFLRDIRRERALGARWLLALVPYVGWCAWVRQRVGEVPFLARTPLRTQAFRAPFVGYKDALDILGSTARLSVIVALGTALLAIAVGWRARSIMAGTVAIASSILALCLGPSALRYIGETLRLLTFPQVMSLVAAAYAFNESAVRGRTGVARGTKNDPQRRTEETGIR